jgi:hypothetical protein
MLVGKIYLEREHLEDWKPSKYAYTLSLLACIPEVPGPSKTANILPEVYLSFA